MKIKTIELLSTFLQIETKNKLLVDKTYNLINKDLFKFRQVEKKSMTDMLKDLNSDGRKQMSQLKKYGLGIWEEGKRGLVNYDPNTYDKSDTFIISNNACPSKIPLLGLKS